MNHMTDYRITDPTQERLDNAAIYATSQPPKDAFDSLDIAFRESGMSPDTGRFDDLRKNNFHAYTDTFHPVAFLSQRNRQLHVNAQTLASKVRPNTIMLTTEDICSATQELLQCTPSLVHFSRGYAAHASLEGTCLERQVVALILENRYLTNRGYWVDCQTTIRWDSNEILISSPNLSLEEIKNKYSQLILKDG